MAIEHYGRGLIITERNGILIAEWKEGNPQPELEQQE